METNVVGWICSAPECLEITAATHVPSRCFRCKARTDVHAIVHLAVDVDGLGIDITPTIDFVGDWDADLAAQVREAVEQRLDVDDPTLGTSDGWQR
jgi:hypothetical protein